MLLGLCWLALANIPHLAWQLQLWLLLDWVCGNLPSSRIYLVSAGTTLVNPASSGGVALISAISPPLPPEYNIVFFCVYYLGRWDGAPTFRGFLPLGLPQYNSYPIGQGLTNFQVCLFQLYIQGPGKWPPGWFTHPVGPSWTGSWPGLSLFPGPHKSMIILPDSRCQCQPVLKMLVFPFTQFTVTWVNDRRQSWLHNLHAEYTWIESEQEKSPTKSTWHS